MATKIRVIKRDERNRQKTESPDTTATKKTPPTARDIVATVTEWVNEFQQQRRTDTTQAIKGLFRDTAPQPSKA